MATPKALILRAPGTNCDDEIAFAFAQAGAACEKLHINALRARTGLLKPFQILVLPGGFSYGDDVGAGKILAGQLQHLLGEAIRQFRDQGKLILGVCNGFQTLLKAGLLVPPDDDGPLATLAHNVRGYQDRWVTLEATPNQCVFLKGVHRFEVPVAHGEGNFRCRQEWIIQGLQQAGQIVLKYVKPHGSPSESVYNPNGSQGDVAGICDATGRVLGLMPHPERHVLGMQHPRWTREGLKDEGDGLRLFRNAVDHFKS